MNFFARTVGAFNGGWSSPEARRNFWSTAVFYNYVQEDVGANPRIRPTAEMWRKAEPALEEVLIEHEPGFVLVLGSELWAKLPTPIKPGPIVALPDGQTRESRLYFNDAGYAFAFGIAHPSSFGWNYEKWSPWVKAALESAIQFQGAERAATSPLGSE
jgi:hypothetical protein